MGAERLNKEGGWGKLRGDRDSNPKEANLQPNLFGVFGLVWFWFRDRV